jgi:hypothetical protein
LITAEFLYNSKSIPPENAPCSNVDSEPKATLSMYLALQDCLEDEDTNKLLEQEYESNEIHKK